MVDIYRRHLVQVTSSTPCWRLLFPLRHSLGLTQWFEGGGASQAVLDRAWRHASVDEPLTASESGSWLSNLGWLGWATALQRLPPGNHLLHPGSSEAPPPQLATPVLQDLQQTNVSVPSSGISVGSRHPMTKTTQTPMQHRVFGTQGFLPIFAKVGARSRTPIEVRKRSCRSAVPSSAASMPPSLRSTAWHCPDHRLAAGVRLTSRKAPDRHPQRATELPLRDGGMLGSSISGRQDWSSVR